MWGWVDKLKSFWNRITNKVFGAGAVRGFPDATSCPPGNRGGTLARPPGGFRPPPAQRQGRSDRDRGPAGESRLLTRALIRVT